MTVATRSQKCLGAVLRIFRKIFLDLSLTPLELCVLAPSYFKLLGRHINLICVCVCVLASLPTSSASRSDLTGVPTNVFSRGTSLSGLDAHSLEPQLSCRNNMLSGSVHLIWPKSWFQLIAQQITFIERWDAFALYCPVCSETLRHKWSFHLSSLSS